MCGAIFEQKGHALLHKQILAQPEKLTKKKQTIEKAYVLDSSSTTTQEEELCC